jgi:hypothetical protein
LLEAAAMSTENGAKSLDLGATEDHTGELKFSRHNWRKASPASRRGRQVHGVDAEHPGTFRQRKPYHRLARGAVEVTEPAAGGADAAEGLEEVGGVG